MTTPDADATHTTRASQLIHLSVRKLAELCFKSTQRPYADYNFLPCTLQILLSWVKCWFICAIRQTYLRKSYFQDEPTSSMLCNGFRLPIIVLLLVRGLSDTNRGEVTIPILIIRLIFYSQDNCPFSGHRTPQWTRFHPVAHPCKRVERGASRLLS